LHGAGDNGDDARTDGTADRMETYSVGTRTRPTDNTIRFRIKDANKILTATDDATAISSEISQKSADQAADENADNNDAACNDAVNIEGNNAESDIEKTLQAAQQILTETD